MRKTRLFGQTRQEPFHCPAAQFVVINMMLPRSNRRKLADEFVHVPYNRNRPYQIRFFLLHLSLIFTSRKKYELWANQGNIIYVSDLTKDRTEKPKTAIEKVCRMAQHSRELQSRFLRRNGLFVVKKGLLVMFIDVCFRTSRISRQDLYRFTDRQHCTVVNVIQKGHSCGRKQVHTGNLLL